MQRNVGTLTPAVTLLGFWMQCVVEQGSVTGWLNAFSGRLILSLPPADNQHSKVAAGGQHCATS